jgi:hypothetical protein
MEKCRHREARPFRSGPRFTTSSRASPNLTACFRSGRDGLRAITERLSRVGLDILSRDAAAFARFESGLPRMHVGWFDDAIELADWDHVPAGFIQTSAIYDHAAAAAQRRGWPVANLQGTHLHPTLHPAETADAFSRCPANWFPARRARVPTPQ